MNDLISRQAALRGFAKHSDGWCYINALPSVQPDFARLLAYECGKASAQPEPHWIPCSERLPETDDEVLTTYIVNGNKNKRYVETSTYYDGDEGHWASPWDEYRVAGTRVEVLAWMPLPKPYKEEGKNATD